MEEQLITLETGKLARKKGFNVPVVNFYNKGKNPYVTTGCEYQSDRDAITDWNNGKGSYPTRPEDVECSAPTQALLQKWLREVHNLYVESNPNASGYGWFIDKTNGTYINYSAFTGPNDGGRWDIYEEALEVGLQEALNLI